MDVFDLHQTLVGDYSNFVTSFHAIKDERIQKFVDDELSIVEVLKTVLKRNGYEVTAADNGATAIELLKADKFELMIKELDLFLIIFKYPFCTFL